MNKWEKKHFLNKGINTFLQCLKFNFMSFKSRLQDSVVLSLAFDLLMIVYRLGKVDDCES